MGTAMIGDLRYVCNLGLPKSTTSAYENSNLNDWPERSSRPQKSKFGLRFRADVGSSWEYLGAGKDGGALTGWCQAPSEDPFVLQIEEETRNTGVDLLRDSRARTNAESHCTFFPTPQSRPS